MYFLETNKDAHLRELMQGQWEVMRKAAFTFICRRSEMLPSLDPLYNQTIPCNNCDSCVAGPPTYTNYAEQIKLIAGVIKETDARWGPSTIAKYLTASQEKEFARSLENFQTFKAGKLIHYGKGDHMSAAWWENIISFCVQQKGDALFKCVLRTGTANGHTYTRLALELGPRAQELIEPPIRDFLRIVIEEVDDQDRILSSIVSYLGDIEITPDSVELFQATLLGIRDSHDHARKLPAERRTQTAQKQSEDQGPVDTQNSQKKEKVPGIYYDKKSKRYRVRPYDSDSREKIDLGYYPTIMEAKEGLALWKKKKSAQQGPNKPQASKNQPPRTTGAGQVHHKSRQDKHRSVAQVSEEKEGRIEKPHVLAVFRLQRVRTTTPV